MLTYNILLLLNTKGIGRKTIEHIISGGYSDKLAEKLSYQNFLEILMVTKQKYKKVKVPTLNELSQGEEKAKKIFDYSQNNGIKILFRENNDYPKRLRTIADAPPIIFVKGESNSLNSPFSVAIVGTREPSDYGFKIAERLSEVFAQNGFTVISGLAKGCDSAAHRGCLKTNEKTVAVMANGLDSVYPKENSFLAEQIIEKGGCLISEYPAGELPRANYFVERNRLQSALSQAVLVVETDIEGGTMHTVGFAQKQNRYLACVGSHPSKYRNFSQIQGNRKLINEGIAKPLSSKEDLDDFLKLLKGDNRDDSSSALENQLDLFRE